MIFVSVLEKGKGLASKSKYILFYQGQGFSLAADIQYVDARWETPVVLPLRDCLSEELNTLCSLDRFVSDMERGLFLIVGDLFYVFIKGLHIFPF